MSQMKIEFLFRCGMSFKHMTQRRHCTAPIIHLTCAIWRDDGIQSFQDLYADWLIISCA